jgi:hypothetical protein
MQPELFVIDDINFKDPAKFHEYLINTYNPEIVPHNLTFVVGITQRNTDNLIKKLKEQGFRIETKYGVVYEISYSSKFGEHLQSYLTYDNNTGIMIFYTNYRKTEDIPIITNFLLEDRESFQLFLRPPIMEQIKSRLICEYQDSRIKYFTARYAPNLRKQSKIRPSYERNFTYSGEDGTETLEELEYYYGVSPTMIDVRIPENIRFRIKDTGLFTFITGKVGTIEILFEIMQKAIQDSIKFNEAFRQTSYKMLSVKTDEKEFNIPIAKPALITLKNKLSYSQIGEFESGLSRSTIINSYAEEGSLFYSADVITDTGEEFRVKANENLIKVFPREILNFNTFMRFYKYIVENFDSRAEFSVRGG